MILQFIAAHFIPVSCLKTIKTDFQNFLDMNDLVTDCGTLKFCIARVCDSRNATIILISQELLTR